MQQNRKSNMASINTQFAKISALSALASLAILGGSAHAQREATGVIQDPTAQSAAPAKSSFNRNISDAQRATADQVAQTGVPLAELAANAPNSYTVAKGDTLWHISRVFLNRPWRWPELWGMNKQEISNPHLIYPGQTLYLDKTDGVARLRTNQDGTSTNQSSGDSRLSPRIRAADLTDFPISTLQRSMIAQFLTEPLVIDERTLEQAPRIIGAQDDRVILTAGDRAYARSSTAIPLTDKNGNPKDFRIYRNPVPLKDSVTGEILGYEAFYLGKAVLRRNELHNKINPEADPDQEKLARRGEAMPWKGHDEEGGIGNQTKEIVAATVDILTAKEEILAGDRLFSVPDEDFQNYTPHAPVQLVQEARIISLYGDGVGLAPQSKVVAINKGNQDGIENGHILSILSTGAKITDRTDSRRSKVKLPDEQNGLLMVFRTFDRVSYGIILETKFGVKVGDTLINPR